MTDNDKDEGFSKNTRDTVIMFVDIAGASEVSNHLMPEKYADFVGVFQDLFRTTCKKFLDDWSPEIKIGVNGYYSARGDEGIFMAYPELDNSSEISGYVDIAINIALVLKRDWLLTDRNIERIENDVLPIELGIGIHVGKTFVEYKDTEKMYLPEGYAINLAKRVESHSRNGRYTRIFVSEAAHGALEFLPDEKTYIFSESSILSAKGFSRDIHALEIKHHFLPTGWGDDVDDLVSKEESSDGRRNRKRRSRMLFKVSDRESEKKKVDHIYRAHQLSPTNLWLAEEYIKSAMVASLADLIEKQGSESPEVKTLVQGIYDIPAKAAAYLAQGDQRDPGILMIQGLIDGEHLDFERESDRYKKAREFSNQLYILDWYEGFSCSTRAYYAVGGSTLNDEDIVKLDYQNFVRSKSSGVRPEITKEWIDKAKDLLRCAVDISPGSAWINFTLGCELIMWAGDDDEQKEGKTFIEKAINLLDDVRDSIEDEPYLAKVRNTDWYNNLLPTIDNSEGNNQQLASVLHEGEFK